jgi:hypothetical protein
MLFNTQYCARMRPDGSRVVQHVADRSPPHMRRGSKQASLGYSPSNRHITPLIGKGPLGQPFKTLGLQYGCKLQAAPEPVHSRLLQKARRRRSVFLDPYTSFKNQEDFARYHRHRRLPRLPHLHLQRCRRLERILHQEARDRPKHQARCCG